MRSTPSARRSSRSTTANWRLLQAAAESYLNDAQHFGFIVAGKFHRGRHRGGGRYVGSYERDRSRALQLLVQGLDRARSDPDRGAAGRYLLALAQALMGDRATNDSWRLQSLTPLDVLADYDENPYRSLGRPAGRRHPSSPTARRSITGSPRASKRPRTTASAGGGHSPRPPRPTPACSTRRARRWPVSCSASSAPRPWRGRRSAATSADGRPEASGPYALDTLKDDETIARLATGIKRFKLPDEFNPIKIYQTIADDPEDRARTKRPSTPWRRSSRTAASSTGPPSTSKRSRTLYGDENDGWKTAAARPDPRRLGPVRADR